ncbi:MAG TPA: DUF2155 domain-containing protein [Alphaproteobacteria bacterium]|nr:DUF2155 domain-containing protein [Alphaproteobacteria bacterium]
MKNPALTLAGLAGVFCASTGYTIDLSALPVVGGQVSKTAAVASGTAVVPAGTVQFAKSAVVRLLDKQTNKVETMTVESGKTQKWGGLSVSLQKCGWGVGGVPVQDAAWLDITAASGEPEFHGWMFNTFPSVATYDHPRFDVELEKCVRPAGYTDAAPARVAPPQPSGPEHDRGGDDEAPQGVNNDFVVPGINENSNELPPAPATVPVPVPNVPQLEVGPGAPPPEPVAPTGADMNELQRMMDMPNTQ